MNTLDSITGYFVTGTDTGAGKTTVSCAFLHAFARRGNTVVGFKPVAAGCENENGRDAISLQRASNIVAPQTLINPYALALPIAPHIAAEKADIRIDLTVIRQAFDILRARAQIVIAEGVGGFLVPLGDEYDTGDLAKLLGLPIILAVGMRLGCINHALLSAQAIQSRGLPLAGWVANQLEPAMPYISENINTLRARLPCPLLGVLPFQPSVDTESLAGLLRLP
ncbi:MAG: dethiobiotin synthase [Nitrosomonas sp.]|nr:dethiobiotin synthase [Nitrosomonas sp.]